MKRVFFGLMVLLAGCFGNAEKEMGSKPSISAEEIQDVLNQHNRFNVDTAIYFQLHQNEFIVAVLKTDIETTPIIKAIRLVKIADRWQEDKEFSKNIWTSSVEKILGMEEYIIPSYFLNYKYIADTPYLYLEAMFPGAGSNYNVDFCLLNLHSLGDYCLQYSAVHEIDGWQGSFDSRHSDSVNDEVRVLMDSLMSNSLFLVKQPLSNQPESPIDEWRRHHAHLYETGTFPSQKFWKIPVARGFYEKYTGSSDADIAENKDYKVISKFKGMVFLIEKTSGHRYLIWVPKGKYHWINSVKLIGDQVALDDNIHIDLKNELISKR